MLLYVHENNKNFNEVFKLCESIYISKSDPPKAPCPFAYMWKVHVCMRVLSAYMFDILSLLVKVPLFFFLISIPEV